MGYALPEGRVYLPLGLLKEFDFENEVAAAIAFQLAHLRKKNLHTRVWDLYSGENGKPIFSDLMMQAPQSVDFFDANGLFAFTDEMEVATLQEAVRILYQAGYDARGLTALLERFKKNPDQSPYGPGTLEKLVEQSFRAIALLSPLRNPIVQSHDFLSIRKRIRRL
jgi:predicted Zn-dependent protease